MRKRLLAVTQLKLNLRFSEDGAPVRHFLQALLLDPSEEWRVQQLDLTYPGSNGGSENGEFLVSAVGDLSGDGHPNLVYAVTLERSKCHILSYQHDETAWRASKVTRRLSSVDLIRSIALGDLDDDGADEIVLGTRPSGAVLILDRRAKGYVATTIDRDQYGSGTTNTREVAVADADSDGVPEILVATARTSPEHWHETPGSIFLYRRSGRRWDRVLIDDHRGRTHTRMVAVADVKDDGITRIVGSAVGVVDPESNGIVLQPELRMYTLTARGPVCETIGTLENMIKSRSFAAGDIDGNGRTALVVGTRALGGPGLETTCLYVFRFNHDAQAWERETLDTSGPFGFHCVAICDVDDDGRAEIIASDEEKGLIKLYRKSAGGWQKEIVHAADGPIFCTAIHLIEIE